MDLRAFMKGEYLPKIVGIWKFLWVVLHIKYLSNIEANIITKDNIKYYKIVLIIIGMV